jgi:hypothetical protein
MPGHPKLDTAVMATSGIVAADQLMQAVRDNKEHRPKDATPHFVKAAIAGAIAIGAYEKLMRDEHGQGSNSHHSRGDHRASVTKEEAHSHDERTKYREVEESDKDGHGADIVAEALGAYALGRQMMGHKEHPIMKLVAEGLGAAGLFREIERDM